MSVFFGDGFVPEGLVAPFDDSVTNKLDDDRGLDR